MHTGLRTSVTVLQQCPYLHVFSWKNTEKINTFSIKCETVSYVRGSRHTDRAQLSVQLEEMEEKRDWWDTLSHDTETTFATCLTMVHSPHAGSHSLPTQVYLFQLHAKVHRMSRHTRVKNTPGTWDTSQQACKRKENLQPKASHVCFQSACVLHSMSNSHQTALGFSVEVLSSCQSQHFSQQGEWKSSNCEEQ